MGIYSFGGGAAVTVGVAALTSSTVPT